MEGIENFFNTIAYYFLFIISFLTTHLPNASGYKLAETSRTRKRPLTEAVLLLCYCRLSIVPAARETFEPRCTEHYYRIGRMGISEAKALSPKLARQTCHDG